MELSMIQMKPLAKGSALQGMVGTAGASWSRAIESRVTQLITV
jgi:hypothetical protein